MIDTTKRPTVTEVTYMMLRKAQRDLIHRLEREYPEGAVYDGFLVEDFRALLKVDEGSDAEAVGC